MLLIVHGQNLVLESGQVVVKTITTYPPLPSKANLILKEKQQNESIIFEKQDDEPLLFPNPAKERVSIKLNYCNRKASGHSDTGSIGRVTEKTFDQTISRYND